VSPGHADDGEHVVEAHHGVGDGDGLDGAPKLVGGGYLVPALVLAHHELHGDPEQEQGAGRLEEGHAREPGDHQVEDDAQADGDAGSEQDADLALVRRQVAAGQRDDDRVVPRQHDVGGF
jgi:hypothetical protein